MSSRTPIQVPTELRDELNDMTDTMRVKTQYEVIQKLIAYHRRNEAEKIAQKAYQEANMVDIGGDMKAKFKEIKEDLGLRTDAGVLEFLADHYQGSLQLGMGSFDTYKRLRGQGK